MLKKSCEYGNNPFFSSWQQQQQHNNFKQQDFNTLNAKKKSLKQIPMQDLDAYLTSLSDKANCAKSEKYEPPGMANGSIPQQHST